VWIGVLRALWAALVRVLAVMATRLGGCRIPTRPSHRRSNLAADHARRLIDCSVTADSSLDAAPREATPMNIYTIVLKRLSTGEQPVSFLTRQENEDAARAYAEAAIANDLDLSLVEIRTSRPACD
jgi:hypothetical protein